MGDIRQFEHAADSAAFIYNQDNIGYKNGSLQNKMDFQETSAVWGNLQGSDFTVLEDTYKFTALQCSPNILVLKVNLLLPLFFLSENQI